MRPSCRQDFVNVLAVGTAYQEGEDTGSPAASAYSANEPEAETAEGGVANGDVGGVPATACRRRGQRRRQRCGRAKLKLVCEFSARGGVLAIAAMQSMVVACVGLDHDAAVP